MLSAAAGFDLQPVFHVLDAHDLFGKFFRTVFLRPVFHLAAQSHRAFFHLDVDIAGVHVMVHRQTFVQVFLDAIVAAAVVARTAPAIRLPGRLRTAVEGFAAALHPVTAAMTLAAHSTLPGAAAITLLPVALLSIAVLSLLSLLSMAVLSLLSITVLSLLAVAVLSLLSLLSIAVLSLLAVALLAVALLAVALLAVLAIALLPDTAHELVVVAVALGTAAAEIALIALGTGGAKADLTGLTVLLIGLAIT